jgi:hypothetical protein
MECLIHYYGASTVLSAFEMRFEVEFAAVSQPGRGAAWPVKGEFHILETRSSKTTAHKENRAQSGTPFHIEPSVNILFPFPAETRDQCLMYPPLG